MDLRAEVAATVFRVVTSEGQSVEAGETVLILESMKMEIPMVAESRGVITELLASEGDVVDEGAILARLDVSA